MALPMKDSVEGVSGKLTPDQAGQLIDLVLKKSEVLGTLLRDPRHFVNMRVDTLNFPVKATGITASGIAEGDIKPEGVMTFTSLTLTGKEMAVKTAISDKLLRDSYVDMDELISSDIVDEFAFRLDAWITGVDQTPHSVWGANASFNDAALAASGNTFNGAAYADIGLLFSAMIGALEANANAGPRESWMFYVKPGVYQVLRDERTSNGNPLFVVNPLTNTGVAPTIYGIPVQEVAASKFVTDIDVYLVDRTKAHFGTRFDTVQIDRSTEASMTLDGTLVSLFERDLTGYRAHNIYAFNVSDVEGFVLASGVI